MNREQRKKLVIKDLKFILVGNVLIYKEKEYFAKLDRRDWSLYSTM